jgi:hypothetical protein
MKAKKIFQVFSLALVLLGYFSEKAFGLQSHAIPAEGQYSHQIGHLFFLLSLVVFAFWLQKTRLVKLTGWRFIQWSCFLFILWNMDAIAGHEVELWLSESLFIGPPSARRLLVDNRSLLPYFYYFLKMDHLLCVPAMVLLCLGLKKLASDSSGESS